MNIIKDYIQIGTKRRSGAKLFGVKFITAHDTGNPNSTAKGNVNYFKNSANEMSASAHTFIDDIDVIECIPLTEKAWHVWYSVTTDNEKYDADANDYSIGVELCYFPNDKVRTKKAYDKYVEYIKELCKVYGLNPKTSISGHFQLDPKRKIDPMSAFKVIDKTWEQFINDLTGNIETVLPADIGDNGANIATIQQILTKGGYILDTLTTGLYDENMAKSVLYFQIKNKVASEIELCKLRGEKIGKKTALAINQLING